MPIDVEALRARIPAASRWTWLNHAGFSPIPAAAVEAGRAALDLQARDALAGIEALERETERVRRQCARLMGCGADEVTFVRNTSHGLSLVAAGIDWRPGDVVLCATSEEYPSNVYPWLRLARQGVELRTVPTPDGRIDVDAFAAAGCSRTRVVTVSSVQYATGWRVDLAALGQLCRDRGWWLCVDAIQSLGAIPLDASAVGAHFVAADAHKWMLGPAGIGVLSVARNAPVEPVIVGWKSTKEALNFDQVKLDLREDAARFEEGTSSYATIAAMGASVDLLLALGPAAVWGRIQHLTQHLREHLLRVGEEVLDTPELHGSGAVFFTPRVGSAEARAKALADRGVHVAVRRGRVRVSPHAYNTEAELEQL
jgi:cysteine desulfurase/selenocysteine lyase